MQISREIYDRYCAVVDAGTKTAAVSSYSRRLAALRKVADAQELSEDEKERKEREKTKAILRDRRKMMAAGYSPDYGKRLVLPSALGALGGGGIGAMIGPALLRLLAGKDKDGNPQELNANGQLLGLAGGGALGASLGILSAILRRRKRNRILAGTDTPLEDVVTGGSDSRLVANTLGTYANARMLSPAITRDLSMIRNAKTEDHKALIRALKERYPELSNTVVHVGPGHTFRKSLYRGLTNPKTTMLGKLQSIPAAIVSNIQGGLLKSPMYVASTDEVFAPVDNLGVTAHELGHAIDFNSAMDKPWKQNFGNALNRDLYGLAYANPFIQTFIESQAWKRAIQGIRKIRAEKALNEELTAKLVDDAGNAAAPAFSTYAVNALSSVVPGLRNIPNIPDTIGTIPAVLGVSRLGKKPMLKMLEPTEQDMEEAMKKRLKKGQREDEEEEQV